MSNVKNLHDVSAIYFFILAFAYIASALALRNAFYIDIVMVAMRILDIPFAMVSLMYGVTTLYLQVNDKGDEETSPWVMLVIALSILLFGLVTFVNFAFPGKL